MKFVCQNCKAKYQIADEKVAGRSVKMKCRQCGTLIPITGADGTAQGTAASVPPPAAVHPSAAKPAAAAAAKPAPAPSAAAKSSPTAGAPVAAPKSAPTASAPSAAKPAPAAAPKSSPTASAPKSSPTAAATPRPAPAPARPAPAPAAAPPPRARPAPAKPAAAPSSRAVASASAVAVQVGVPEASAEAELSGPRPIDDSFDDEMTRVADSGALAGAFAAAVAAKPARAAAPAPQAARDSVPASADEWFVGINGVPVGPLRLSELRSRAQSGAIGTDNLVWRDGFEEWLPLHKFPELVAIVEDGMSSARASLAPLPVPREHADPFARPQGAVGVGAQGQAAGAVGQGIPESGPVAVKPAGGAAVEENPFAPAQRRSGMSMAAIFAMVVAVGLGLALGFVVFGGQKTKIVREVVEVPADRPEDGAPPPPESSASTAAPEANAPAAVAKNTGSGAKSGGKVEAPAAPQGLSGLSGLSGLKGPSGGPSSGAAAASGGQPLDSSQVQSTVGRYTSSVKRSCWQPALDTRDKDAPTSARVTVAITVGGDGKVRQATTSGDPRGYSGLASCISRRVQTWQFPPSSGTTTVNVPFVFAAQ